MSAKQKKTAGRPVVPEEDKRTSRMSVGLTEYEHAKFILFAQKQGWSIAELLRNATKDFIKRQEKGQKLVNANSFGSKNSSLVA